MAEGPSVAIIGGGIGGLAAAASLLQAGFDVQVYEQAKALGEVGAGINVGPNASRVLHRLGLGKKLDACGVKPSTFDQRRWDDGRFLLRSPLGAPVEEKFGAPYYTFHRADLHGALAGLLPADRVHLGHRFKQFVDRGDKVEAQFDNGTAIATDVLIGADGIHSVVRHALLGPEQPHFTGCVAYRGLVPADRLAHLELERVTTIWMGQARHFVHYFVAAGRMVNFVAVTEEETWQRESWVDRGEVADALAAFAGWHPLVRAVIGATDETYKWALFDRAPLPRWSAGRVTLLGDACHPMLPFMGQGAAQAIEDAATLTACLAKFDDVAAALQVYEKLRLPRASRLQAMSADNKTRFHLADGPAQQERDAQMARGSTDWSFAAIAWLYEHDASVLDDAAEPASAAAVVRKRAASLLTSLYGAHPMPAIPEKYLDLLKQKKAFASLATVMPDGSPQVTPVWFDYTGDVIRVNTAKGRVKARNMQEGSRVALSIMDPDNAYRYIQVRGRVKRVTENGADAHIDSLAKKYIDQDKYPWRREGETRVTYEIEPTAVQAMG